MTDPVLVAVIAGGVSLVTACITAHFTRKNLKQDLEKTLMAEAQATDRLRREFQLEFASEHAARALLEDQRWVQRSFDVIKHHLGGFEDEELRKLLVRAGAIRFTSRSGTELWGLLNRNRDVLGKAEVDDLLPCFTNDGDEAEAVIFRPGAEF